MISASGFGCGNALQLPFAPEVRFELGKNAQHIEKCLSGGVLSIDGLLRRP
jgi:hypothetical protein